MTQIFRSVSSLLASQALIAENVKELIPLDETLILYCRTGGDNSDGKGLATAFTDLETALIEIAKNYAVDGTIELNLEAGVTYTLSGYGGGYKAFPEVSGTGQLKILGNNSYLGFNKDSVQNKLISDTSSVKLVLQDFNFLKVDNNFGLPDYSYLEIIGFNYLELINCTSDLDILIINDCRVIAENVESKGSKVEFKNCELVASQLSCRNDKSVFIISDCRFDIAYGAIFRADIYSVNAPQRDYRFLVRNSSIEALDLQNSITVVNPKFISDGGAIAYEAEKYFIKFIECSFQVWRPVEQIDISDGVRIQSCFNSSNFYFENFFTPNDVSLENSLDLENPLALSPYTRKINGLLPEINADNTKWQVGVGTGQIVDAYSNAVNPLFHSIKNKAIAIYDIPSELDGTTTSVYAYYYWDGTDIVVAYQTTAPIADELVDKLFLCVILSDDGVTIDDVRPLSLPDEPETKLLLQTGAININDIFPQPIANTMRLSIAAQSLKFAGRNAYANPKKPHTLDFAAIAQIDYYLAQPDGSLVSNTLETDFNFNRYWDNNAITVLSDPNYFSVQFLFRYPNGVFVSVLGIHEYTSLEIAATFWRSLETFRKPLALKHNALFLCAIAGKGNATNITNSDPINGEVLIINEV